MLIAFDVGNTETTIGVFAEDVLVARWRLPTDVTRTSHATSLWLVHALSESALPSTSISGAVIGSVVPSVTDILVATCDQAFGVAAVTINARTSLPVTLTVDHPESVGIDRILNVFAAHRLFGVDAICIDAGTATTIDCITQSAEFLGGVIMPGVWTAANALISRAAQLSLPELPIPTRAIGTNTTDCLRAGVWFGAADAIDGVVQRIKTEWPSTATPLVIATGGLSASLALLCRTFDRVEPSLTLHGLRLAFALRNR